MSIILSPREKAFYPMPDLAVSAETRAVARIFKALKRGPSITAASRPKAGDEPVSSIAACRKADFAVFLCLDLINEPSYRSAAMPTVIAASRAVADFHDVSYIENVMSMSLWVCWEFLACRN
jgi:hypothetical protein